MTRAPRRISHRRQQVGDRSSWECIYCGRPLPQNADATNPDDRPTIDHLIPRSKGGDRLRNQVLARQACNNPKGDTDLPDWLEERSLPTGLHTSRPARLAAIFPAA